MCAKDDLTRPVLLMVDLSPSRGWWYAAQRGSQLLLSWRHVKRWWRMCPCYCYKMFHCLGKVQETTSNTDFQACVTINSWKSVSACIRSALLHGSETWAPTALDLQRLRRNDRAKIRWICGVKPHDEVPMETLYTKLGIQEVAVALRTKRLRWYGHVACASFWTN